MNYYLDICLDRVCRDILSSCDGKLFFYDGGFFSLVDFYLDDANLDSDFNSCFFLMDKKEYCFIDLISKWISRIFVNQVFVHRTFCGADNNIFSYLRDNKFSKYFCFFHKDFRMNYCLHYRDSIRYRNSVLIYFKARRMYSRFFRKLLYRISKRMLWFYFFDFASVRVIGVLSSIFSRRKYYQRRYYLPHYKKNMVERRRILICKL